MDIIDKLSLIGIVPVLRVEDAADAPPLCKAITDGGLPVAEITFRTDAAAEAIRRVHAELPEVLLGAGTVLTPEQADRAVAAGAAYIVSPGLNPRVVRRCLDLGVPVLPGCASPSEIEAALELGLHAVKFFPAEALGGVKAIQAMSVPYGDVTFLPTGGVNERNLLDYLACPKVLACGGSWMADAQAVAEKNWARIEALTRGAVSLLLGLELRHVGVNSGDPQTALRDAERLCRLLGWQVTDGVSSAFAGTAFELMKKPFLGTHGHIAIGCNDLRRARWHLERRGFAFDDSHAYFFPDGRAKSVYLQEEIGGFAIHLLQK